MQLKVQMLIHQTKTSFWRTFHHSQPISSLLISNPSNILCIVQYNLYFVNARALKNPSRNVSAKTLTTNFAIHVKIGRTLEKTPQLCMCMRQQYFSFKKFKRFFDAIHFIFVLLQSITLNILIVKKHETRKLKLHEDIVNQSVQLRKS